MRRAFQEVLDEAMAHGPSLEALGDEEADVCEVLANGIALDEAGVLDAMEAAVDSRGRYRAPLVVVAGTLVFRFAEVDMLRAMVEIAAPITAADVGARSIVDEARHVGETSSLGSSPAVEAALIRVREAVLSVGGADLLQGVTATLERSLLQDRRYQRRSLFGGDQLRAAIICAGRAMPVYLPAEIATRLPLIAHLPARVVAEAHHAQEQNESSDVALRAMALARVLPAIDKRRWRS